MDGFVATLAFLCLAGVMAVIAASGYLKVAQQEFQSRLRNAALNRARHLLLAALAVWGGAVALGAFAAPKDADAAARQATAAAAGPAVHLRIDDTINYTGR